MSKIKLAVQYPAANHTKYADIHDIIHKLDESGIDIIFGYDHFFVPQMQFVDGAAVLASEQKDLPNFEPWTTLAAWAEQTQHTELGILVSGIGYRNPDLLADMARTVDHISQGRLILGLGAGWFEKDYAEYGYEFGTFTTRFQLFAEGLGRINHRFTQLNPPPLHKIPILIGGGGEKKTLPLVAQYADIWHAFGDVPTLTHKSKLLDELLIAQHRQPETVARSTRLYEDYAINDALVDAGFSLFVLAAPDHMVSFNEIEKAVKWRDKYNSSAH